MPASEIDDIFSRKLTRTAVSSNVTTKAKGKERQKVEATATDDAASDRASKKTKKRKRHEKQDESDITNISTSANGLKLEKRVDRAAKCSSEDPSSTKRKRVVETVHDPSSIIAQSRRPTKLSSSKTTASGKPRLNPKKKTEEDELQIFTDSRGTGPRTFITSCPYIHHIHCIFYRQTN